MLYIVHNHTTGEQSILTQLELEAAFSDLKSSTIEIVDEIDDLSYARAQTFNECMAPLWELVAYSKPPFTEDGTALTHQELIQSLEAILPQMDQVLTPSGTLEVVDKVEQDYPTLNELLPTVGLRLNLDIPTN